MPTLDKKAIAGRRITDPAWYREQLQKLVQDCDDNIKEDQELADNARSDESDKYLARVETTKHWQHNLRRILRGYTFAEELEEGLKRGARRRG